jgi:serine O-acetyltransferase
VTVWRRLQQEARKELDREAVLAPLYRSIEDASSFEEALIRRLASRLSDRSLSVESLTRIMARAVEADATIGRSALADVSAVVERDPASERLLEPFLFFKGFAAIQTHRVAHWLWSSGHPSTALYLQSRSSELFQTDIHPAASFGMGIFLDHATGFVAGETVVIEDNVSILHGVTLGGSGIEKRKRHPNVRTGVLIGAGAQILGDVEIGAYSKIAAGSVVTQSIPPRSTAVGVPARIVEGAGSANPAKTMDQQLASETYESFMYVI